MSIDQLAVVANVDPGGVSLTFAEFLYTAGIYRDWEDPVDIGLRLVTILGLLLLNGFFVAAEFALVKVKPNQLETLAEAGKSTARLAVSIVDRLDSYLSACQLGITMASIALGWIGQPLIARVLQPLVSMTSLGDIAIFWISIVVAFAIVVFLHVIIGELIPKLLAMHSQVRTSLLVARPLHGFYLLFRWPIVLLNASAEWLVKNVFRVDIDPDKDRVHSGEELRALVEQTEQGEDVTDTEREILINALALNDRSARDILTPRAEVVTLDVEKSFDENLQIAIDSKHTRFPLVEGHLDKTIGLIHIKDVVGLSRQDDADLQTIRRDIIDVEELMPLDALLQTFLANHAHVAVVKDEFGGSLGLVMLDDVLEELVGEIQDEFDEADDGFHRLSDEEFVAAGSLPLHALAAESGLAFDTTDVSTVGGYLTHAIGHLPKVGESVLIGDYQATVSIADERSVTEVRFKRLEKPAEDKTEESGVAVAATAGEEAAAESDDAGEGKGDEPS